MTSQDLAFFQVLSKDRAESADMLEKPSMRGIKNSVVEKYSDQAHFIYELLQNADDARATNARFILEPNRLIFAHNGTRHFSVTNPAEEERDSAAGTLGDINAITSIANSNKTEASIGKFGVGFKAVFQYTSTPHIYDPGFRFRIDRFIVPSLLNEDFPGRKANETLFVFPFDHPYRRASEAYDDISEKLRHLSYPLLFLTHIKEIEFEFSNVLGLYGKEVKDSYVSGDTVAEYLCLTQNSGNELIDENLWLLSRLDENGRRYSVGFFTDSTGHLRPVREPAFCFFPTKEVTGLNFIIHAPFLLTDSREGIRAGIVYNDNMLYKLAVLSADALVFIRDLGIKKGIRLIDDNIVNIIPINPDLFSDPKDRTKVSFRPFYDYIHTKFAFEKLLPAADGYVDTKNAYWAALPQLTQLFSNEQLSSIVDNPSAKWVFVTIGRDEVQRSRKALFSYLDGLVKAGISEDIIISGRSRESYYNVRLRIRQSLESISGISSRFIEAQSFQWLHSFYKWLSETKHRTEAASDKPIFLDQYGKAAAAFDEKKHAILFLPAEGGVSGYRTVHPELLKNQETRSFIEQLGIKQPSLKDQIYNIILPMYRKGGNINTDQHFSLFFRYYCSCTKAEADELIGLIKGYKFLTCYRQGDPQLYRGAAESLYFPTPELLAFLKTKKDANFIALEKYKNIVSPSREKQLTLFLTELGVSSEIRIIDEKIDTTLFYRDDLPRPHSTREISWNESRIDGCREIMAYIITYSDTAKSVLLWNLLLRLIKTKCGPQKDLESILIGVCRYYYRTPQTQTFTSIETKKLREGAWLVNSSGALVSPKNVTKQTLSSQYDTESDAAQSLLRFLGIADRFVEENDANLSDFQKVRLGLANRIMAMGIDANDLDALEEFLAFKRQQEARKQKASQRNTGDADPGNTYQTGMTSGVGADDGGDLNAAARNTSPQSGKTAFDVANTAGGKPAQTAQERSGQPVKTTAGSGDADYNDDLTDLFQEEGSAKAPVSKKPKLDRATSRVVKDIVRRAEAGSSRRAASSQQESEDLNIDQDEFTPATVDYSKRIERAKQKSAAEIEKIAYFEELQERALLARNYSYGWFKALIEMECINSNETNSGSKEVSISFAHVEREAGTKRTLVLKHPDRYIPQFMEDLADIPLVLHIGEQTKTIAMEVMNIQSYTLRVKLKSSADIDGIDLTTVTSATIDAQSPTFLLEELKKQFALLGEERGFTDDYDMQANLCKNIDFIFGPPGTGKTTYLARNVLLPIMRQWNECKVLVLTPTNKAADVLVRRIMEVSDDVYYNNWLVRFGATGDEEIEQSPIFRDKTFDIRTLKRNVTVTTIARFPYDFFMPQGSRLYLNGINWDYIVIDEASMIPIANIVYPLYKKTPRKFIIAGDPFQIEPITTVDLWKNENIYTMVHLDSFTNPTTIPHKYNVKLLTTQYRSIPDIGYLFSNFAYGGILQHYRSSESQRPLNTGAELGLKTLNIIKFPVSKYESIYRCKRLQHSSAYQVYSALFTFEYVCYLSKVIAANNPGSIFKIGIIAPYRAQADMIEKLMASEKLPGEVDVQVGTIHGFQGDECDIIFAVFNTPPTISASKDMFLNKRNIINVSISRAKDYLFIVMPDDNTENIDNLQLVRRVERLVHDTDAWSEFSSPDLEYLMFNDPKYLENNAFSTSHQSVNVYGLPERCYEVRTEDNAVDIQIHRSARRVLKGADE